MCAAHHGGAPLNVERKSERSIIHFHDAARAMGGDIISATGTVIFTRSVKHTPARRGGASLNVGRKSDNSRNFGDGPCATAWWCRVIERTYAIPWES